MMFELLLFYIWSPVCQSFNLEEGVYVLDSPMIGFIEHVHQIAWLSCLLLLLLLLLSLICLCIRTAFAGSAYYGIFLLVLQFLAITLNTPQLSQVFVLPTHLLQDEFDLKSFVLYILVLALQLNFSLLQTYVHYICLSWNEIYLFTRRAQECQLWIYGYVLAC